MDILEKLKMVNEIKSVNYFTGISTSGKKVLLKQEKNGMYYGEIRDKHDDLESSTTAKTSEEVKKWFYDHGIKNIKWNK